MVNRHFDICFLTMRAKFNSTIVLIMYLSQQSVKHENVLFTRRWIMKK